MAKISWKDGDPLLAADMNALGTELNTAKADLDAAEVELTDLRADFNEALAQIAVLEADKYKRPDLVASSDYNTITTTGVYKQIAIMTDALAQGAPIAGFRGELRVMYLTSSAAIQVATSWATAGPRMWTRAMAGSVWGAWVDPSDLAKTTVTVDNTVGRRAFAWDADNARQQMIMGDTGLRDITALATNVATGLIYLQRVSNMVTLTLVDVGLTTIDAGSNSPIFASGALPSGFRSAISHWWSVPSSTSSSPTSWRQIAVTSTGWVPVYSSPATADRYRLTMNYPTNNTWPTSLPGTAVGTGVPV